MRLMVSGSAALPASLHERWTALTSQKLLERYGMTEIGMAISNPYRGERRPGAVGQPLPGVEVRLKTESGAIVTVDDEPGEIQVRGPGVFRTTGIDLLRARSRSKTAGFAPATWRYASAATTASWAGSRSTSSRAAGTNSPRVEIEAALLEHPSIAECAVIGLPDDTWGEIVTAVVVLKDATSLELPALRDWCKGRLSAYKIPQRLLLVKELPRNAMGKVSKPAVRTLFSL